MTGTVRWVAVLDGTEEVRGPFGGGGKDTDGGVTHVEVEQRDGLG